MPSSSSPGAGFVVLHDFSASLTILMIACSLCFLHPFLLPQRSQMITSPCAHEYAAQS
jgi:hypothetical protein